jgi:hypothetical protein
LFYKILKQANKISYTLPLLQKIYPLEISMDPFILKLKSVLDQWNDRWNENSSRLTDSLVIASAYFSFSVLEAVSPVKPCCRLFFTH